MYCKNCGEKLNEGVNFCFNCGFKSGEGQGYCDKCGVKVNSSTCSNCGNVIEGYNEDLNRETYNNQNYNSNYVARRPKSKIAAGILGILVGGLGIHRFYLGYVGIGILQIVVTVLTCGAGSLWGFIEGILILCGTTITTDADGVPLSDN
ncbi:NINE protein [Clostridium saudiense]|uniref:NINE protein n=1 Tax=Clostridium saudiense TaxID=1414720 RepID=A0ABS2FCS6_9CLOT|nr:TM2 domain-containing protein [Clostridium saudiense]MBM6818345.1 NINE protein [Clostridium saudiense]